MKLKILTILAFSLVTMYSCSVDDTSLEIEGTGEKVITKRQAPSSLNLVTNNYAQALTCNNANLTYSERYYESEVTNNNGQDFINSNHSYSVLLGWNIDVALDFNQLFFLQLQDPITGNIQSEPLPNSGQVLISHLTYQWPSIITPSEIVSYKEFQYRFVYHNYSNGELCVSQTGWRTFNLIQ